MPTSTFYHDNLFRTFPLTTNPQSLLFPRKRLVGAKVCCSFGSPFHSFPRAALAGWEVFNAEHRLTFHVEAGGERVTIPVSIPRSATKFEHVFSKTVEETSIRLTVGDLAGETETFPHLDLPLEPTLVLWLAHRGIREIRFGNESRHRLSSCLYDGISDLQRIAYTQAAWWNQDAVVSGPLLFNEGFNCRLVASISENTLRFIPQAKAGLGETTEFVPLGSTLIDDQKVYETPQQPGDGMIVRPDGLPPHDRLLRSFCGATGPEIEATVHQSIQVRNDIDGSTVSVRIAALGEGAC